MDKLAKVLPEGLLRLGGCSGVGLDVEAGGGDLGREPVGGGEADGERYKVLLDLLLVKLLADLVERFNGLWWVSAVSSAQLERKCDGPSP